MFKLYGFNLTPWRFTGQMLCSSCLKQVEDNNFINKVFVLRQYNREK